MAFVQTYLSSKFATGRIGPTPHPPPPFAKTLAKEGIWHYIPPLRERKIVRRPGCASEEEL